MNESQYVMCDLFTPTTSEIAVIMFFWLQEFSSSESDHLSVNTLTIIQNRF